MRQSSAPTHRPTAELRPSCCDGGMAKVGCLGQTPSSPFKRVLPLPTCWFCIRETVEASSGFEPLMREGAYSPRTRPMLHLSPGRVAVTVAVNRGANGEVGVKSYSKTGGECGIR